ncbi:unnamed protein product [Prorocentrum cordatum]|uniref:WGR domain-containing protein n=1 Tax=Prorocentrum cordatum TaxID=2364126 RepID=A0ABN9WBT4_9DINO|nr:unnamed protein product [Polarella glacialis]
MRTKPPERQRCSTFVPRRENATLWTGWGREVGITQAHSRVGFVQVMSQFGEVVYCRKPPYSGLPGEDYVNIGFGSQQAADRAYQELKAGNVYVDGCQVGVGQEKKEGLKPIGDDRRSRSRERRGGGGRRSPPGGSRANFKQRHDERSPSPRTMAREAMLKRGERKRSRSRRRRRRSSSSS